MLTICPPHPCNSICQRVAYSYSLCHSVYQQRLCILSPWLLCQLNIILAHSVHTIDYFNSCTRRFPSSPPPNSLGPWSGERYTIPNWLNIEEKHTVGYPTDVGPTRLWVMEMHILRNAAESQSMVLLRFVLHSVTHINPRRCSQHMPVEREPIRVLCGRGSGFGTSTVFVLITDHSIWGICIESSNH